MVLSLIQTSQNRRSELTRFIRTLNRQQNINFKQIQLIFIDQGDNEDIFTSLNPDIDFVYIKYHRCSLSHARNVGLEYVKGTYIGFPDDDCWYEPDTLYKVMHLLLENRYQGISGKGTNEKGELTSIFPRDAALLTKTKRCAAISYTLFFKYNHSIKFDEDMGVGSPYNIGAGEETDYLLSLMILGYKVYYDPTIIIHHPTVSIYSKETILRRTYSYARGAGYLMKKHSFPFIYCLRQFIRPLGGIFMNACKFKFHSSHRSFLILKGRIEGFYFKRKV